MLKETQDTDCFVHSDENISYSFCGGRSYLKQNFFPRGCISIKGDVFSL